MGMEMSSGSESAEAEIASTLQPLFSDEKNQMALRALCCEQGLGNQSVYFYVPKENIPLSYAKIFVRCGSRNVGVGLRELSAQSLAVMLDAAGASPEDVDEVMKCIQEGAARMENTNGEWYVSEYGPNNDKTVPLNSLWEA